MIDTDWIILDTETTGLVAPIYVIEVAAQHMRGWEPVGKPFHAYLNHRVPVPMESTFVHEITTEFLDRQGRNPVKVHGELSEYIRSFPVVAHNLNYDWERCLLPEWKRLSIAAPGTRGFCSMLLSRRLIPETQSASLDVLRDLFQLSRGRAHSATGDVAAVVALFQEVLQPRLEAACLKSFEEIAAFSISSPIKKCHARLKQTAAGRWPKVFPVERGNEMAPPLTVKVVAPPSLPLEGRVVPPIIPLNSRAVPPIFPSERRPFDKMHSHLKDLPSEYRISIPPKIPSDTVELPSTSEPNVYYKVNLREVTCTCPSFPRWDLWKFPVNDPRRYCKHLAAVVVEDHRYSLSAHARLFLQNPSSKFIEKHFLESGVAFYFCHNGPESEWVNVHAREKKPGEDEGNYSGALTRYGFSLSEDRWSYREKPAGVGEIRKLIKARFKSLRRNHAREQRIEEESIALVESQEDGDDGFGFGIGVILVLSIPLVFIIGCIVT
jgi:DNA polymerase III epsilon subunit-like protein